MCETNHVSVVRGIFIGFYWCFKGISSTMKIIVRRLLQQAGFLFGGPGDEITIAGCSGFHGKSTVNVKKGMF